MITLFVCFYEVPLKVNSVEFKHSMRNFVNNQTFNGHLLDRVLLFSSKPSIKPTYLSI